MIDFIHFAPDQKFIDSAYRQFYNLPWNSKFYIKLNENDSLSFINTSFEYSLYNSISEINKEDIDSSKLIFFHSFNSNHINIFKNISDKSKVIVLFWGYEFYDNPMYFGDKSLFRSILSLNLSEVINEIKRIKKQLTFQGRASRYIQNIGIFFEEDVELMKLKGFLSKSAKRFHFFYYPFDEKPTLLTDKVSSDSPHILIGNSASASNNHKMVFDKLTELNLDINVVCPLNYGDRLYGDYVSSYGASLFGSNFFAIRDFLSLSEYNRLLDNIDFAIFATFRQQAVGNIVALLGKGVKIFLSEKNTFYWFLKREDFTIFSFESDFHRESFLDFSKKDKMKNCELVYKIFNSDSLHEQLVENIKLLL